MPYANKSELGYMLSAVASELADISTSTTPKNSTTPYLSDVKMALRPLFPKADRQSALVLPRPCLLVWPEVAGKIQRTIQDRRVVLRVYILGIVSVPFSPGEDGAILQDAVFALWDDVHRCMLNNPMRLHPEEADATANTYGFDTDDAAGPATVFDEIVDDNNQAVAAFASRYAVSLRLPR